MQPNDEPFLADTLDAQLDALAGEGQSSETPTKKAYHHLSQLYAPQAAEEAQAIERVRRRLASYAATAPASPSTSRDLTTRELPSALPVTHLHPLPPTLRTAHAPRSQRAVFMRGAVAALVVAVVAAFAVLRLGGANSPATNSYHWTTIPGPNTSQAVNGFTGITMRTATDGWAWGYSQDAPTNLNSNPISAPLVEHWDGKRWSIVPTPAMPYGGEITDIVSLASDNAWAVGDQLITPTSSQNTTGGSVIEHWDGTRWTMIPANLHTRYNTDDTSLASLVALAPNDIWAVGSNSGAQETGLIVHWDGQQWQEVAHPAPSGGARFTSISAIAPNDIWVTGMGGGKQRSGIYEHWDGVQWRTVPAAQTFRPGILGPSTVTSIAAVSANDIWAVGHEPPVVPFPSYSQPLIEHWDGQNWSVVASPSVSNGLLASVVALGPNDVWAVGTQGLGGDVEQQGQGLVEHWDGQQWSLVINPSAQSYTALRGVVGDPATQGKVWVVGATGPAISTGDQPSNTRTLIETGQ